MTRICLSLSLLLWKGMRLLRHCFGLYNFISLVRLPLRSFIFTLFSFVLAVRMGTIHIQNMMLENFMPSLADSITQCLQQIT